MYTPPDSSLTTQDHSRLIGNCLSVHLLIASTMETLPNLVLRVLCACGLPVSAVAGEIEISGLSGLSVPKLRHLETSQ